MGRFRLLATNPTSDCYIRKNYFGTRRGKIYKTFVPTDFTVTQLLQHFYACNHRHKLQDSVVLVRNSSSKKVSKLKQNTRVRVTAQLTRIINCISLTGKGGGVGRSVDVRIGRPFITLHPTAFLSLADCRQTKSLLLSLSTSSENNLQSCWEQI